MIAFVRGTVAALELNAAVLDVAGVGYRVQATPQTLGELRVGDLATLPTSLVVREESLTLYGFGDAEERDVFEILQTASGVGPRLAQAILAVHRPDQLRQAVTSEDLTALTKVPGIGKKGAQRIVLELKDKLTGVGATVTPVADADRQPWREQVRSGLTGLGWSTKEAEAALESVSGLAEEQAADGGVDVGALLRAALKSLSKS